MMSFTFVPTYQISINTGLIKIILAFRSGLATDADSSRFAVKVIFALCLRALLLCCVLSRAALPRLAIKRKYFDCGVSFRSQRALGTLGGLQSFGSRSGIVGGHIPCASRLCISTEVIPTSGDRDRTPLSSLSSAFDCLAPRRAAPRWLLVESAGSRTAPVYKLPV